MIRTISSSENWSANGCNFFLGITFLVSKILHYSFCNEPKNLLPVGICELLHLWVRRSISFGAACCDVSPQLLFREVNAGYGHMRCLPNCALRERNQTIRR